MNFFFTREPAAIGLNLLFCGESVRESNGGDLTERVLICYSTHMIYTEQKTIIVNITMAECGRCGYKWELKRTDGEGGVKVPKNCPRCHSPYWNKERKYNRASSEAAGGESVPERLAATFQLIDRSK